jgi:acyl carrier protein phosphodiesterase
MDHYLANDATYFATDEALNLFSKSTYALLRENSSAFPEKFARTFEYMQKHDWLSSYKTIGGIKKALGGLRQRAKYMKDEQQAFDLFMVHYHYLSQCYLELMTDLADHVKLKWTRVT